MSAGSSSAAAPAGLVTSSRYSDLLLVAGVVAILAMMVLPLPIWLIDVLVALNMCFGVMLLLVSLYIRSPLEFSAFPSVLLITTLFRLAISIATTRMILLTGDGGHIIDTFGRTVAGGSLVVGLVVFLIITVVQFIVVAKGAERVAEVAARFSLDAMPGKQLSIDSDLRSGLLDKDEARRRRSELEQESKLHGSLDGAMKFVKGDAIAGIVIIVINLVGGLAIGVMQQDLSVGDAMHKYSILSIGEGMVAQIPALLSAMAAGLIVTRSNDEHGGHLGDAIGRQIAAKPRVLLVASGLCVLLALVPGFPWPVFLALALVLGCSGALLQPAVRARWARVSRPAREGVLRRKDALPSVMATAVPVARPTQALQLEVPAEALEGEVPRETLRQLETVLDRFNLELGLLLPRISLHAMPVPAVGSEDAATPPLPRRWRLLAYEVPVAHGEIPPAPVAPALGHAVHEALRRHSALFLGTQEAGALLSRCGNDMPDLVKETLRMLPLQRVAEILRRLVEEEVPIRNMRDILEGLVDAAQREKDVHTLAELARIALKRQISHRAAPQGLLRAVMPDVALEEQLRKAIRVSNGTQQLALDPQVARAVIDALVASVRRHRPAAVVTAVDLRRHVRKLIEAECFETPVLSFHELVPTLQLEVLARVTSPRAPLLESA